MSDAAVAPTIPSTRKPTLPKSLGAKSRKFWRSVTGEFELRADELVLLENACREMDLIDRLNEALEYADIHVEGSQGQPVINPLFGEIRQHRLALKQLLGQLDLPEGDTDGAAAAGRSSAGRHLAAVRWQSK